jgi:hypothetical protein
MNGLTSAVAPIGLWIVPELWKTKSTFPTSSLDAQPRAPTRSTRRHPFDLQQKTNEDPRPLTLKEAHEPTAIIVASLR